MVSSGADRILRFYKPIPLGKKAIESRPNILNENNMESECVMTVNLDADVLTIAEIPASIDLSSCVVAGLSDCSIRIWSNQIFNKRVSGERSTRARWECTATLHGHSQAVLCLAAYPHAPKELKSSVLSSTVAQTISWATSFPSTKSPGAEPSATVDGVMIISGSADHTVRLWGMVLGGQSPTSSPPSTASWVCFRVLRGHNGDNNAYFRLYMCSSYVFCDNFYL